MKLEYTRTFLHPGGPAPVDVTLDAVQRAHAVDVIKLDNTGEAWVAEGVDAPAAVDGDNHVCIPEGAHEVRADLHRIKWFGKTDLTISVLYPEGGRLHFAVPRR